MLQEKAMLATLNISQWTARKYDRKASQKVARDNGTLDHSKIGRYNKILIATEAIQKVSKAANAARKFHYDNTLPWTDAGARILPASNFDFYSARMRVLRADFESEMEKFISAYPDLVEEAKIRLNGLFSEDDYPPVNAIRTKFSFDVVINPIPAAGDFRVSLTSDEIARVRREIETRVEKAQNAAMNDLWTRLYKAVKHMADKLSQTREDGKAPIFRDSLVENLCSLSGLLPRLNVTNDPNLENMRRQVEEKLCLHTPQELRKSPETREEVARDAKSILESITESTISRQHDEKCPANEVEEITNAMSAYMGDCAQRSPA